jgi:hypothetical protein
MMDSFISAIFRVFFVLPGKMIDFPGYLFQVFPHFLDLIFHVPFVFPQQFTALLESFLPLHAEFHKVLYLFDGHSRIFKAADKGQPFKIVVRITAYPVAAAGDAGKEPLVLVITEHMGGKGGFLRHLLDRIGGRLLRE